MDCASESVLIRRELEGAEGVESLAFDHARGRMVVVGPIGRDAVEAAVARTGLEAEAWTDKRESRTLLSATTALSGAALLGGLASGLAGGVTVPFHAVAIGAGVWHVLPRALNALRHLRPDMHLLMCIAIAGAIGLGDWTEGASVAFLYSLSLALEAWSVGRARNAVEKLLQLTPATATLVDGATKPADQVAVGTRIVVKPGERVPLDGVVAEGESEVDQSPLTGESLPVGKAPGDELFAGTINGSGALVVETTKMAGETTVAHMVRLVEMAGERRSASERWVERFARIYTPAVMALAALVLVVPPLLFAGDWGEWFYKSLVLLVIACPCALVISTPVSIVAGLASAARHGVLVKGGDHLETPARLDVIAFDKTGTLTEGRPRLMTVEAFDGHDDTDVLARAAAVEAHADHPIARAITVAAAERGIEVPAAANLRNHPGKGAEGVIDGKSYWVGSHRFLDELRGAEHDRVCARMEELAGPGHSVLFVGNERHICGILSVADEIRPGAAEQVAALKEAGIGRVVMLTGDNRPTAEAIGKRTGVDEVFAELLPEQKVDAIAGFKPACVAMVGDGINDAPAMARADLGIAMATRGTDIAIETADIALMTDDLSRLAWLVRHSRRTLAIIRQNAAAAILIKLVFVILTFLGFASLWTAIAADMGVSLAVTFNALRLLRG